MVGQMTSVASFGTQFQAAMATPSTASAGTNVLVASIPDVYQLWNLFKNNFFARFIWAAAGICQSLLANPGSTQAADVQRRAAVRQRNIDFNAQLAAVCAQFDRCLFDANAAFNTAFTTGDVRRLLPSIGPGSGKLAAVSWAAGYTWTADPPPPPVNQPPVADFSFACINLACSFTDGSTDDGGSSAEADLRRRWVLDRSEPVPCVCRGRHVHGDADRDGRWRPPGRCQEAEHGHRGRARHDDRGVTDRSGLQRPEHVDGVTILVADTNPPRRSGATVNGTWTVGAADACVTAARTAMLRHERSAEQEEGRKRDAHGHRRDHATPTYQPSITSLLVLRP